MKKIIIETSKNISIEEVLTQYNLEDLTRLRYLFKLNGYSKMRKQAIINKLVIDLSNYENYKPMLMYYSLNTRNEMLTMLRSNKLIELGVETNLLNYLLSHSVYRLVVKNDKIFYYIHPLIKNNLIKAITEINTKTLKYKNTNLLKAISGIVSTHGIMSIFNVCNMIMSDQDFCLKNDIKKIDMNIFCWIPLDDGYNCDGFLIRSEFDDEELEEKIYPRKMEEFMIYSDIKTILNKHKYWHKLSIFLTKYKCSKLMILELSKDIFEMLQTNNNPKTIVFMLTEVINLKNDDDFELLVKIILDINNNTPLWSNGGATPLECRPKELRVLMN